MKRLVLFLIACVLVLGACASTNSAPPTVIYPDAKEDPMDYNPIAR